MAMREAVLFEVFLDIHKAYDALYRGRCLENLAENGVGPRVLRLFWAYWGRLTMVTRTGGYFGLHFKGYH